MIKFPEKDEMKNFSKVEVITREPLHQHQLSGMPQEAFVDSTSTKDIVIITSAGYYIFNQDDVITINFRK